MEQDNWTVQKKLPSFAISNKWPKMVGLFQPVVDMQYLLEQSFVEDVLGFCQHSWCSSSSVCFLI